MLKLKNKAFTMAEVLITLGIIGIVAAMTLPNLIKNHEKRVLATQMLKSKNFIENGYRLMVARHNSIEFMELAVFQCETLECMSSEHKKVFNILVDSKSPNLSTALLPELSNAAFADALIITEYIDRVNKTEVEIPWGRYDYSFVTVDGYLVGITDIVKETDNYSFKLIVDVNSSKKPNAIKEDLYALKFENWVLSDYSNEFFGRDDEYEASIAGGGTGGGGGNTGKDKEDNPNKGPGNNNGNNHEDNPNKGPGNNSGNDHEDNPNKGPGNNSGNGNTNPGGKN